LNPKQRLAANGQRHSSLLPVIRPIRSFHPEAGYIAKAILYELPPPATPAVAALHNLGNRAVFHVFATRCILEVSVDQSAPLAASFATSSSSEAGCSEAASGIGIGYDAHSGTLTLTSGLPLSPGTVQQLLQVWQGVCHMCQLTAQVGRLPEAARAGATATLSTLRLRYGPGQRYEAAISVTAGPDQPYTLRLELRSGQWQANPHCFIREQLREQLAQTSDLAAFYHVLVVTLEPLAILRGDSTFPLPVTAPFPLGAGLFVLPRSVFRLRLSLQSKLAVDLALESEDLVRVKAVDLTGTFAYSDALSMFLFQADKPMTPNADGYFALTYEEFHRAVGSGIRSAGNDNIIQGMNGVDVSIDGDGVNGGSEQQQQQQPQQPQSGAQRVTEQQLEFAPNGLHGFLLAVMALRVFARFATERLKLPAVEPPGGSVLTAAFTVAAGRTASLALTPKEGLPYLRLAMSGVGEDVAATFQRFLQIRMARAPFRPLPMASMLGLLQLPVELQEQFAQLMRIDLEAGKNPASFRLHVTLDDLAQASGGPAPFRPAIFSEA